MRDTIYAIVAATLAMLATSGIVALATAAPETEIVVVPDLTAVVSNQDVQAVQEEANNDAFISAFIDAQYRQVLQGR